MPRISPEEYPVMIAGLRAAADYHRVQAAAAQASVDARKDGAQQTAWSAIHKEEAARSWACEKAAELLQHHSVRVLSAELKGVAG